MCAKRSSSIVVGNHSMPEQMRQRGWYRDEKSRRRFRIDYELQVERLRRTLGWLFNQFEVIPLLMLGVVIMYPPRQRITGMGFFSLGVVSMIALDYRFRKLVAAKDKASAVSLVGIVLVCAVESFAVAAFNGDVSPFHTLFKPIQNPTDDGATIVKAVMVKDLVLRLASLGIKAMIGLVGTRASTATSYRRQQRMYEAIEVLTLCVRSIVSTFLWVTYYQSVHLKLSAQVLYVCIKGFVTARAVAPYWLKFGSSIAECCICFDAIPSPRACAHMLCRECAVECDNSDRVASCHHCRRGPATKHTSPKYGGSSPLPEFF